MESYTELSIELDTEINTEIDIKTKYELIKLPDLQLNLYIETTVNDIINEIINNVTKNNNYDEYRKIVFIEKLFETIMNIIERCDNPITNNKLEIYEYFRYGTIAYLLRDFMSKLLNCNFLDELVKTRLYKYLENSYTKSKYYLILKNISNTFKNKNIDKSSNLIKNNLKFKSKLWEYLKKQYEFLGIIQNKKILKTINKESLDELFNKIIFELTIYILYFSKEK